MKNILVVFAFCLFTVIEADAQAPSAFNYQGIARSTSGAPLSGTLIGMRLTIHDLTAGGSIAYQETQTATTNSFGLYTTSIGSGTVTAGTFGSINWGTGAKFLEVEIDPAGGTAYTSAGTSQLLSVPYAVYANTVGMGGDVTGTNNAATVTKILGNNISATAPTDGQSLTWNAGTSSWTPANSGVSGTGTANYVPVFTSATAIGNSIIYQNPAAGNRIGINNGISNHGLVAIKTTSDTTALYINQSSTPGTGGYGVERIEYTSPGDTKRTGILSTMIRSISDVNGIGVEGAGNYEGLYGLGEASSTSGGNCFGAEGDTYYSGNYSVGVAGFGSNYTGTAPHVYGVYGTATGGTSNYAVYSDGAMHVNGAISKLSGTFKIDHPLDPENKYLSHSFVESPDMMNIYNGNVTTDASGKATVTLPDYFEALNMDFRYQMTVIGQPAQVYVSKEISSNQFEITTDKPNVKVSWQVTGVRHDAWADAHRVVPEQEKETFNKGLYMAPKEYGKSDDLKIGTVKSRHSKDDPAIISHGDPKQAATQPH